MEKTPPNAESCCGPYGGTPCLTCPAGYICEDYNLGGNAAPLTGANDNSCCLSFPAGSNPPTLCSQGGFDPSLSPPPAQYEAQPETCFSCGVTLIDGGQPFLYCSYPALQ